MTNREYLERRFPEEMNPSMSVDEAVDMALSIGRCFDYMAKSYCSHIPYSSCSEHSCRYCTKRWLEEPSIDGLFEDNISENINEILV